MNKLRLFLIAGLAAVLASCGGNDKGAANTTGNDSTTIVKDEPIETNINIRYVSMDSIYKYYVLAQNVSQQAQALASDLQSYQAQLQNQLQNKYNQIQQKAQNNGYLSQASYEADLKELEKTNASFQNMYAQREANAAKTLDARQKELNDSVQNFIKTYNKEKKYDAILIRDAALYFNTALDITEEVIKGLNERYKGEKSAGAAAAATTPDSKLNTPASPATLNAPSASEIKVPGK